MGIEVIEDKKLNPWISIWRNPSATMQYLLTKGPNYLIFLMVTLYGLTLKGSSIWFILLATLFGYIASSISALLLYWTGKWIGGKGTMKQIRMALLWSCIPRYGATIITLILFPWVFLHPVTAVLYILAPFTLAFSIWSFIASLCTLKVVQGYESKWRVFGNMCLASIIPLLIGIAIITFAAPISLLLNLIR